MHRPRGLRPGDAACALSKHPIASPGFAVPPASSISALAGTVTKRSAPSTASRSMHPPCRGQLAGAARAQPTGRRRRSSRDGHRNTRPFPGDDARTVEARISPDISVAEERLSPREQICEFFPDIVWRRTSDDVKRSPAVTAADGHQNSRTESCNANANQPSLFKALYSSPA